METDVDDSIESIDSTLTPSESHITRRLKAVPQDDSSSDGAVLLRTPHPIRVMYLQGLQASASKAEREVLAEAVGQDNLFVPDLHTKRTIILFTLGAVVILLIMCGAVIAAFVTRSVVSGFLSLFVTVALATVGFVLGGRGVTHLVLKQAVASAEVAFRTIRPNVIVASAFGAVVCFQMDIPKVPLLLLGPAQDQYYRYMHMKPYISIGDYPYIIVVHGSMDTTVPLDDSIRLVETCEVGRCRLEVVDDDHKLSSLTPFDISRWIEEAFERGKEEVLKQSAAGSKNVDPTLFDVPEGDMAIKA